MAARAGHVLLQACPERLACQPAEGARIYSPTLGRFLQTDPIGYEDQYNLYAYAGNDPVNGVDPTGLEKLILFDDPDADSSLIAAAEAVDDIDGVLMVFGHGNPFSVEGRNAEDLARAIRGSGLWKKGMPVLLLSCRSADTRPRNPGGNATNSTLAEDLSQALNTKVTGSTSLTYWSSPILGFGGFLGAYDPIRDEKGYIKAGGVMGRLFGGASSTPGNWRVFQPGQEAKTIPGPDYPRPQEKAAKEKPVPSTPRLPVYYP